MDLEDFLSLQLPLFINVLVLISLLLLTNIVYSSVNVYMAIFNVIIVCHYKNRSFETIAGINSFICYTWHF